MKELEQKIISEGRVLPGGVLKVDAFLNHQVDVGFAKKMAKEWKTAFDGESVNKILTIESSGIALATPVAMEFEVPLVFAKKHASSNIADSQLYVSVVHSFTHGNTNNVVVSKKFLSEKDRVLIIDDFLANGEALRGLVDICKQAGATVVGCGIAIEKAFQGGGEKLRSEGIKIISLAKIQSMSDDGVIFCKD